MDVETFLCSSWGITITRDSRIVWLSYQQLHLDSLKLQICWMSRSDPLLPKQSSFQLFQRFHHLQSQWGCGFPDGGGLLRGSGGVSPTLFPLPCTQLSMPQPLSTSTALPAPLPCVDGQWHKVHRSPGSPPSPAADLLHSSSPSPSSSCSSCSDPPRSLLLRPETLRRAMHQEGLLLFSSQRPRPPCCSTHPRQGCHGQPTSRRRPRWSSGVTCEAATNICKVTCAGGSCSPTRSSSSALVKMESLMAPRTGMIRTVSQRTHTYHGFNLLIWLLLYILNLN